MPHGSAITSLGFALSLAIAPLASSDEMITLSTLDSAFEPGTANQGWWSDQIDGSDTNDNYIVGVHYRDFFTFDLSCVTEPIGSATLYLRRGGSGPSNEAVEVLEFFAVSVAAAMLNNNDGMNAVIFDDLGSGTSYGAFSVAGAGPAHQQLAFSLNANAISDLNDARGGFFSLGGTLTSAEGNDFLFGSTQQVGQSLVLVPVPEPSTGLLVTMALIGLALQRRSAGSTRYSAW